MNLTNIELDALTELFNVGLHRAAASLSSLTGQRIKVDMPRLWISTMVEAEERLLSLMASELATVHQNFGGAVAGDAALLMEYDKAALLANLMTAGSAANGGRLNESAREVLAEVGNVVLGGCLSSFGDMLNMPVSFSVPRIQVDSLHMILRSMHNESPHEQYAVIAATQFRLSELAVDGYLIVVVGARSLSAINTALSEQAS
jgi:chemotaxis protein CheC